MRLRARHLHLIEGLIDTSVAFLINYFAVILVFNGLLGYEITWTDNGIVGCVMFFIALARKYTIRRWMNDKISKLYKKYELQEQTGED